MFSFISSDSFSSESDAFAASTLSLVFSSISSASSSNESDAFAAPIFASVFQLPLRPHFLIHLMHSRPHLRQFHFAQFCSSFASSILACGPLDPGRRIFVSGAAQRNRHFEPDPSRTFRRRVIVIGIFVGIFIGVRDADAVMKLATCASSTGVGAFVAGTAATPSATAVTSLPLSGGGLGEMVVRTRVTCMRP